MSDPAREVLALEQRAVGSPCTLLRFWDTDVPDEVGQTRSVQVIVYSHGYATFSDRCVRFAVYDNGRHVGGGIIG